MFYFLNNNLRYSVTMLNGLIFAGKINQNNFYFSSVISINSARCIEAGDTLFNSQTTPGTNLCF